MNPTSSFPKPIDELPAQTVRRIVNMTALTVLDANSQR